MWLLSFHLICFFLVAKDSLSPPPTEADVIWSDPLMLVQSAIMNICHAGYSLGQSA